MSATVKLMLLVNKELQDGRCPVALRFTAHRKSKYLTLPIRVRPQDWEDSRSRVKPKHSEANSINEELAKTLALAEKVVSRIDLQTADVSTIFFQYIDAVNQVGKSTEGSPSFLEYLQNRINTLYSEGREGTARCYKEARSYFMGYLETIGKLDIKPNELNPTILLGFQSSLRKHTYSENTVSNRMRAIRATYNLAKIEGIVSPELNAFLGIKFKTQETAKRSLSLQELKAIKSLEFNVRQHNANQRKKERYLEMARNIFFFLIYTRGMNLFDAAKLTSNDIQDNRIVYRRSKTSKPISIAITEPVSLLLEYFNRPVNRRPGQGDYLLPIMKDKVKNYRNYYRQQQKRLNERLKEVCVLAEINKPITTYWSRHSFATLMKHNGVPVEVISEALGHKDIKTTQIYLASFEREVVDKASNDITALI